MAEQTKSTDDKHNAATWIDAEFMQTALHLAGESNLRVMGVTVGAATAAGDHYSSTISRVKIELSDGGERSYIVKSLPPLGEEFLELIRKNGTFHRETKMLAYIIPQIENLLEEVAPGRYPALAARCPHHGSSPDDFLVLEDLVQQGFRLADRHRGLGLRHCIIAVRALGRYHAGSVALMQNNPSAVEQLGEDWVLRDLHAAFVSSSFIPAIDECRRWPGFESIADKLEAFKGTAAKTFMDLQDPRPGKFNVIIHGDFWTNNMMFSYEDGLPKEVRFVDLQISHVASPAIDLLYFLNTSPSESVSTDHQDLLLREYHRALVEAMDLLGLQAPSLEALQADVDAHGSFALFPCVCVLPIVKANKALDMEATMDGDGKAGAYMYRSPVVKRWFQRLLPEYHRKGWLP